MEKLKKKIKKIVMVQGDDPMLKSQMIEAVVKSNNIIMKLQIFVTKLNLEMQKILIELKL